MTRAHRNGATDIDVAISVNCWIYTLERVDGQGAIAIDRDLSTISCECYRTIIGIIARDILQYSGGDKDKDSFPMLILPFVPFCNSSVAPEEIVVPADGSPRALLFLMFSTPPLTEVVPV